MNGSDYTVVLALEDFVPTGLALVGFWILAGVTARVVPRVGPVARVSAVLIGLGGLAKSTWKLLLAGFSIDLPWLEAALFPLMAVGAVGLVWGLASALRGRSVPWWPFAAVLVVTAGVAAAYAIFAPIFALATTGVTTISVSGRGHRRPTARLGRGGALRRRAGLRAAAGAAAQPPRSRDAGHAVGGTGHQHPRSGGAAGRGVADRARSPPCLDHVPPDPRPGRSREVMTDALGWRRKFGVIAPSTNTIVEPDFYRMTVPGVTAHFSRIHIRNQDLSSDEQLREPPDADPR